MVCDGDNRRGRKGARQKCACPAAPSRLWLGGLAGGMMWLAAAAVFSVGCEKEADLLGRDDDGRMATLSPTVHTQEGSIRPVGYQPTQSRESAGAMRTGEGSDRDGQPVRRNGERGADAEAIVGAGRGGPHLTAAGDQGARERAVVDRGAAQLVAMMKEALGAGEDAAFRTSIAIRSLRNQSRTPAEEVEELRDRLAALLNAASTDEGLRFTREVTDATEYTLGATVYLIQRDGFDQYEIYCALRPVDANWTIWRNDDPVRMLRQKRAGGDAIQLVREP